MRLQGLLLFLFIPLVLGLFLVQPLGPGWSVVLGLAIMVGHRLVAAPWMAKYADARCLWCGRVGAGTPVNVQAGGRAWTMTACTPAHAAGIAGFLRFTWQHRVVLAAGIFVPLAWLLVASLAIAAGYPVLPHETNALIFRLAVAVTVVAAATIPFASAPAMPRTYSPASGPVPCPFPLHNLFLLGIRNTMWTFRIVGAWWIVDVVWRLVT